MGNESFFKIDIWWKAVLYLGILSVAGAILFNITLIERKYLFGLGIGMIMIGLGFWKAWKTFSKIAFNGILSWKDYKHDLSSIVLISIGLLLTGLFGFLIIKGLL